MMHTGPARRKRRLMCEINVVPYIDVMLVLLVIFMITTPLLSQGVDVELPQVASAKPLPVAQQGPIVITVDAQGGLHLNVDSESLSFDTLERLNARVASLVVAARGGGHERSVLIRGDQKLAYGKMVSVLTSLQQAGVTQVGLVTNPLRETDGVFTA